MFKIIRRKMKKLAIIVSLCCLPFMLLYYVEYAQSMFLPSYTERERKTLLLWTPWFGNGWLQGWDHSSWTIADLGYSWEGNKHIDLRDFGCDIESFNCTLTSNRSYLEDESMYDGLLFHQFDINQMDIPDQANRGADQVYMFHTMETPKPGQIPNIQNNFFNVTMTYSSKSEIHQPYGRILKRKVHHEGKELDQYITTYGEQNARILGDKNFSAAILMSNCQGTTSDRESVIGDLSKLITVDIYGACGKLPPNSEDHGNQDASEDTQKQLAKTHPFYLSFENSLCEDYVTEKFYSALNVTTIPVVLNAANMSQVAPRHSYIDVRDFATTRELADYLQIVYSNPALYASYFWWREFYEVVFIWRPFSASFLKTFCEACRYLHAGKKNKVVKNLQEEWVEGRCSQPPVIGYMGKEDTVDKAKQT